MSSMQANPLRSTTFAVYPAACAASKRCNCAVAARAALRPSSPAFAAATVPSSSTMAASPPNRALPFISPPSLRSVEVRVEDGDLKECSTAVCDFEFGNRPPRCDTTHARADAGRRLRGNEPIYGRGPEWLDRAMPEPVAAGERSCSSSRGQPQLAEDVRDVAVHGVLAEDETRCDLAIRTTLRDEVEHLQLASAQAAERSVGPFGRTRHARRAELLEHRLGAAAFPVGSDRSEVLDRGLHLALCLIGPAQRVEGCREVEPHSTGLEGSLAGGEQVERVLERASCSVVVAARCGQRSLGGGDRSENWPRAGSGGYLAELAQRVSGALMFTQAGQCLDCQLEACASLDPAGLGEPAEIAIS